MTTPTFHCSRPRSADEVSFFNLIHQMIILSFVFVSREEGVDPSLTVHVHRGVAMEADFVALRVAASAVWPERNE